MPRQTLEDQRGLRTVTATAHSKVNLHLGVGPVREDGYHELVTIFQALSLHDEIILREVDQDPRQVAGQESIIAGFEVNGNPSVPTDSSNLAWRAIDKLYAWHRAHGGKQLLPVTLELNKGIPAAGGMAGGSADAAAALRAFNALLPHPASEEVLLELSAELGSDVPFTLSGGTQRGTGRGENLTPVISTGTYHWALAFAKEGLSTPAVFAKLDTMQRSSHLDTRELALALRSGDVHEVAANLHNDMQAAALSMRPSLRTTLERGQRAGALRGIVSGSGPTCAFLCEDAPTAQEVAAELGLYGAVAVASGPAPGAQLSNLGQA